MPTTSVSLDNRETFTTMVAETLNGGYTLTAKELAITAEQLGGTRNWGDQIMFEPGWRERLATKGVTRSIEVYKGRRILYDGNLPLVDTDIDSAKQRIDERLKRK